MYQYLFLLLVVADESTAISLYILNSKTIFIETVFLTRHYVAASVLERHAHPEFLPIIAIFMSYNDLHLIISTSVLSRYIVAYTTPKLWVRILTGC